MAHTVQAPFPGVFYRRPDPDSDPFVTESDTIEADTVIGVIEVMKMFQEIRAEQGGTVAEFLVENETSVDAGQPLLRLT
ncbi:acetyl-CoA carboxylase [Pseudonocardia spinosispora]|uniref:acetyl-CoA carboxylase n=1 Tax=Pseudonocardia spinosispora TaxID=103441 RepID=UPI000408325D|nr:acetyl-CoA carboxylase [Pseudonocardia spinosispora]